ncbi:hypothetical protein GPECTOR_13g782 [Gonium pectorale]|uniref:PDEase domain-containing protein n=1 Tax=Gonium pectorale TaxID=33097 RepID=A0A150GNE5_GONPE|nr:hypothetical protein GPECTOR_13g782 [Gonium pectorale]|eukprot:KXZ51295.1 hypothetical protein GPECTOR_13g782 [Gonium pectorale]
MQEEVMRELVEARRGARAGKADTPADLLLALLSDMLLGRQPPLDEVELARGLLLRHLDPYQPLNLRSQMREANLDVGLGEAGATGTKFWWGTGTACGYEASDVVHSLMMQLGAADQSASPKASRDGAAAVGARARVNGGPATPSRRASIDPAAPQPRLITLVAERPEAGGDKFVVVESLRDALLLLLNPSRPGGPSDPQADVTGRDEAAHNGCWGSTGSSREDSDTGTGSGQGSADRSDTGSDSDGGPQPRAGMPSVPPPMLDEVEMALAGVDAWQYDTHQLAKATQGHALSVLGFHLLQREGLISQFRMHATKLARLLRTLESGYTSAPYHNSTHAADVLQTLHVLLRGSGLREHYLDRLGLLAAYFAAIVHDHGHPGLTADFLIATSDPLAVRYNDRSPLENHHGASFFALVRQPDLDALGQLAPAERVAFRKQVLDLVMATDMKQHFSLLAHFNTAHQLAPYSKEAAGVQGGAARRPRPSRCGGAEMEEDAADAPASSHAPRPKDETERTLSLQIALKCADLGHLGEELEVHSRWIRCLEEEFFLQGDRERQLSLPISPLFDRAKQGVSKSQVGFFDFIALPLVHAMAGAFPGARPLMDSFVANYEHWRSVERTAVVTAAGAASQPAAVPVPKATAAAAD